jgi:hypothetical protein
VASGHRLHQATAGIRIVVIVLRTTLEQGVETQGEQTDHSGHQTEAALKAATHIFILEDVGFFI